MSETFWDRHGVFGLMAQFEEPEQLLEAANRAYAAGYRNMDAYSPMPIDGLAEAVGFRRNWVSLTVLIAGMCGCVGGFSLLWWITVVAYPHNVAGRPFNSWPAYIPITFECTVLLAALTAVVGMLAMNKLPMPYHPVFNVESFSKRASIDRFFLCIEASDPKFEVSKTRAFLEQLNPEEVAEVEK
jgi:Alternative complex III, ActD subunit